MNPGIWSNTMSILQDFAGRAADGGVDLGPLAVSLCELEGREWDRLMQLRAQLVDSDIATSREGLLLALVLPDRYWKIITSLRDAMRSTEDPAARAELRDAILGTLSILVSGDPIETSPIDDPLPSDDPEVDRQIEEDRRRFHRRYFELKARAGLSTIHEVARKAGISPTTVQAIESHAVRPQFRTVRKIAEAFGVPVTELWPERR